MREQALRVEKIEAAITNLEGETNVGGETLDVGVCNAE